MSTQFTNRQWRLPNNENKDKQSNYSMDFDGASYIDLGNSSLGLNANTISIWFKTTSTTSGQQLLSKMGSTYQFQFRLETNGTITLYSFQDQSTFATLQSASGYNDGNWHNVITTFNTTDGHKMYVDGNTTPVDTDTVNKSALQSSSERMLIGVRDSSTGVIDTARYFNGKIDAVSIFNYALTDGTGGTVNQIAALYGSSSTGIGNPMSLSPAPVAYYPLGDQDAFNGAEYLVPNSSLKDYVFDFDGSNDYIDCGNDSSLNISGDLTISAWVYLDTTPNSYMSIFSKMSSTSRNYTLYARSTRQFSITTQASGGTVEFTTSNTAIPLNTWTHIVVTFDSGVNNGTKYYFNGIPDAVTGTHNVVADTSNLNIGKRTTSTQYLDGKISNAQIFNTALPATGSNSVETLYNNGSPLTSMTGFTSLQGWWKLDASATYDGSDWTIPDDSSNSNDGTSSGMTQANLVQSDLSFTSGYSPYALNFDGANDYIEIPSTTDFAFGTGGFTISLWVNFDALTSGGYNILDFRTSGSGTTVGSLWINSTNGLRWYVNGGYLSANIPAASFLNNTWYNVIILNNGSTTSFYLNGTSIGSASDTTSYTAAPLTIGDYSGGGYVVNGSLSNVSIWNADLTSAQVTEIYNEGVPSNLNNHSAYSNLVSWWQLGSNSSFNTNWTVLDEKGSNNGTSVNMIESDIVDGVNSYANGLSSGMGGDEVIGDAPYSSSNSLSVNMDVEDRITDTPS